MKISMKEIQELIEGQTIEFKKSLSSMKEALETLCGMINADVAKGAIFFGVSPDVRVIGIDPGNLDTAQRTLAQHINQKFAPPIICTIDIIDCEGMNVIRLESNRAKEIAYHEYDGRAYIREGSTTRQLSYDEKQQLMKKRNRDRHNGPWKCDRCGTFVGTLSSIMITDQGIKKTYNCQCGGEFWPVT